MKKIILPLLAIFLINGCKKEDSKIEPLSTSSSSNLVTYTEKKDINKASVKPEALEYYKNIATIANWYAEHPSYNKMQSSAADGDTANTLLAKISALTILDTNNVQKSIFEISPTERAEFLDTWALVEARDLSEKLKLDTSNTSVNLISERNAVYNQTFGSNKMLDNEDPYWKLRHAMDLNEKKKRNPASNTFNKTMDTNSDFYATVVANGILGCTFLPIGAAPPHLPAQTFVDRIRTSLQPGRLLIALPGGSNGVWPIIVYPNSKFYDPGHVAIISVNPWQVPSVVENNTHITIGADSKDGMHEERINADWASIHGLAYVGQVYTTRWVTKWTVQHLLWFTTKTPYYVQEATDVNNNAMFNEAQAILGKPYCHVYELLTAKWAAPARFICSTTAWWCAKKSANVNIGDFYKSTIFPAGVLTSDRVRIVRSTTNN